MPPTATPIAEDSLPAKTQVLRNLREWLRQGVDRGDALPSERAIALQLKVDRKTVRRALEQLEHEGVIASNGDRRPRTVRNAPTPGAEVLQNTVVMISDTEIIAGDGFRVSAGWDVNIQLQAIERLHAADTSVLALTPNHFQRTPPSAITALRPAGVLMLYGVGQSDRGASVVAACAEARIPCVIYGDAPPRGIADRVCSDHEAGAYQLTRWLLQQGRQRIQRVWRFPGTPRWIEQRNAGYERAMREAGLQPLPAIQTPDLRNFQWSQSQTEKDFADLARVLLGFLYGPFHAPEPPDAIMVATDPHAYQVAGALRLMGIDPQRDVPIVGYDNTWQDIIERQWEPVGPAATIDKQNNRVAEAMTRLLLDRIGGQLPPEPQVRQIPPRLVQISGNNPAG